MQTIVFISYNGAYGFNSGWYGQKVFISANYYETGDAEETDEEKYSGVMYKIPGQYYWGNVPIENVERYYIYSGGKRVFGEAISLAKSVSKESGKPTTIVTCRCDWEEKECLIRGTGIQLVFCECGGRMFFGKIIREILRES